MKKNLMPRNLELAVKNRKKIIRPIRTVSNFLFKFAKCIFSCGAGGLLVVLSLVVTWISGFEWLRDLHELIQEVQVLATMACCDTDSCGALTCRCS